MKQYEENADFEKFLVQNNVIIAKDKNYNYSYLNRIIYDEWMKSPAHGLAKIEKLRNNRIHPVYINKAAKTKA